MRMDDLAAEEMYDEEALPQPPPTNDDTTSGDAKATSGDVESEAQSKYPTQVWTEEEIQADFMRAEALKFDELLGRIDLLLGTSDRRDFGDEKHIID